MQYKFDSHVHSTYSCDGKDSLEDMVVSAINKGLQYICFTEHIDHNPLDYGFGFFNYPAYSIEIEKMRDKYSSYIEILKGIEFSEPHLYKKEFEKELKRDYDMIMVALHWIDDKFYGDKTLLKDFSSDQLIERYFNDLQDVIDVGGFDVLAHFDFPRRYYGKGNVCREVINTILEKMIQLRIIIEINSSGIRKGYGLSLPGMDIVGQYLKLGGVKVTLGSDGHSKEEICADFDSVLMSLKGSKLDCGVFVKRQFKTISTC